MDQRARATRGEADGMTHTVTIPVDLKAEALSANGREHWSVRKARTKVLRDKAKVGALAAHIPPMSRAHLTVTVHWPDRRRRDVANLSPTIKALVDGMVTDAGLLPDDSDAYLVGPDLRVSGDLSRWQGPLMRGHPPAPALLTFAWDDLTPDGAR